MFSAKPRSIGAIFLGSFKVLPRVIVPGMSIILSMLFLFVFVNKIDTNATLQYGFKFRFILSGAFVIVLMPIGFFWLTNLVYDYLKQQKIFYKATLLAVIKKYFKLFVPIISCGMLFLVLCMSLILTYYALKLYFHVGQVTHFAAIGGLLVACSLMSTYFYIYCVVYKMEMLTKNIDVIPALKAAYAIISHKECIMRGIRYSTFLSIFWILGLLLWFVAMLGVGYILTKIFMVVITQNIAFVLIIFSISVVISILFVLHTIAEVYFYNDLLVRYKKH